MLEAIEPDNDITRLAQPEQETLDISVKEREGLNRAFEEIVAGIDTITPTEKERIDTTPQMKQSGSHDAPLAKP